MTAQSTVLVVDDEPMVLSAIDIFLSLETPHRVVSFTCPKRALAYLENHEVDVVVSDFAMHTMCGAEFLSRVARIAPSLPRVLLTGVADEGQCKAARDCAGLFGFLEKPWCNEELRSLIDRAVSMRKPAAKPAGRTSVA